MKAKLKSGKIITGRLADTFTKIGLSTEIKRGRKPNEVKESASVPEEKKQSKSKKNEKVS